MSNNRKLTPKLRFPEFRKAVEWEEKPLGEIFDTMTGGTPERTVKEYWNGSIPWVTTSLVDFNTIYQAEEFITEAGLENSSAKLFPKGTILMALYGQGKTRGKVALLGIEATTNQACAAILPRDDFNTAFTFLSLCGRYDELRGLSNSGGQENLSQGLVRGLPFRYPADPAEQRKIADCLSSLDELIAAEGRKLESLRAYKNGLMQQLFPRDGETTPRLRFPEFRDGEEWDEKTIGSVCKLKAGEFVSASAIADKFKEGRYPCYGGNGLRGYVQSFTHEGTFVLIGRQGALCGNVNLFHGKFHATEHALVVTPHDGFVANWLYYAFGMLNLNRFSIGQAQPGLSVGVLNSVALATPSEEAEQQRIAACLSSLDARIDAQSEKLDALRTHKAGLMQQLFPSAGEVEA